MRRLDIHAQPTSYKAACWYLQNYRARPLSRFRHVWQPLIITSQSGGGSSLVCPAPGLVSAGPHGESCDHRRVDGAQPDRDFQLRADSLTWACASCRHHPALCWCKCLTFLMRNHFVAPAEIIEEWPSDGFGASGGGIRRRGWCADVAATMVAVVPSLWSGPNERIPRLCSWMSDFD